jgi:hypothetical protein
MGRMASRTFTTTPDKNAAREGFKVDLLSAGTTQDFNLEVAGKEADTASGSQAVDNVTRGSS